MRSTSRRLTWRLQRRVGLVGAGDDEQPAGPLVEPVDDAGALGVAAAAEHLFELGDQGRPAVRGGRVDDEAGRLVDHGEVLVEVDDPRPSRAHRPSSRRKIRAKSEDAGGDRHVGEVERRPGADFDVVGDLAGAHPVDRLPSAPPATRPTAIHIPGVPSDCGRGGSRRSRARATAKTISGASLPLARPNATPWLWARVRPIGPEHVDLLARARGGPRPAPWPTWSRTTTRARSAPAGPGAQRGALLGAVAHPRIRPTTTASTTKRTISAITGAKLKAMPPPPTEGTRRRKTLR